jgi:hypothetical protein|tara:strand:+ start:661 stop:867 length:207 start_codon:yes stop_codon:yes gene_type:complete
MIKTLLIISLLLSFGLMFLGVIGISIALHSSLYTQGSLIDFPIYLPLILIASGGLIFLRTLHHINNNI